MNKYIINAILILTVVGCSKPRQIDSLVPNVLAPAPNYWCTWYWQNYLILKGQEVTDPNAKTIYSNEAARETLNENNIFGEGGMAVTMLPKTRGDYYFLIDHGWQDKSIKENQFFTLVMDTQDFPRYAHLEPKDRIRQMNNDIKDLGWRGLGLWVRGNPSEEDLTRMVRWSKYAGVEYWKIDGGDITNYTAQRIKEELYSSLTLEYITGTGPVNSNWDIPGLTTYPSVYNLVDATSQELTASLNSKSEKAEKSLEVIKNTDVFRTYDAAPLMVSTTAMQRIHDILSQTAGKGEYRAHINIQDDCNIAAALGLLVGVKRHPMKTPRMYKGKDFHLQIAGSRNVNNRLNEMDRLVLWQRIAPPMSAGYGTYRSSDYNLVDSTVFQKSDTWLRSTHGKMVRQSAPAIMTRNLPLPLVEKVDFVPYVMASKFPNGAVAIATEGRVTPDSSWVHPRVAITLLEAEIGKLIGVFGYYESLTIRFTSTLPKDVRVIGQDLLADHASDLTDKVTIGKDEVILSGLLIEEQGTMAADTGDISVPGLVIKIIPN